MLGMSVSFSCSSLAHSLNAYFLVKFNVIISFFLNIINLNILISNVIYRQYIYKQYMFIIDLNS